MKVYDGPSVNDRLLLSASGASIPGPVSSTTGQMLVTFTTDQTISGYKGFLATYTNGGPTGIIFYISLHFAIELFYKYNFTASIIYL